MNSSLRFSAFPAAAAAAVFLSACADTGTNVAGGDSSSQGTLVANTRASSGGRTEPAMEASGTPEGIMRRNGRLYYVKNRGTTALSGRQRVTRELFLESNGDVSLRDGRRVRVIDGYMVTTGGEIVEAPAYLR